MTNELKLKVNGSTQGIDVEANTMLLYVLRDGLELYDPKFVCGLGQCGACTVHLDGKAICPV